MNSMNMVKESPHISDNPVDSIDTGKELILHNDDVNTFEYVIETLIDVCGHQPEQAEQCAILAHTKGKCGIRKGDYALLKSLHDEMIRRGLTTTIE
jgi:ATP-dependent Clp protease adaptor protein ClpS